MKIRIIKFAFILIAILICSNSVFAEINVNHSLQSIFTEEKRIRIESWINSCMKEGKIPGLSVVIVDGDKTIYKKGFGYSNCKTKNPVTAETLFELGSTSKAFTALGILKLEKDGKINLNDPVNKYIPWFSMRYTGNHKGEKINGYVNITLKQLLYHSSGVPFSSIGDIPIDESDDALEKTIRTQVDKELDFYPGDKFLYATINYDILGLVIQNVSHMSYEEYIQKNILDVLGLKNTYLFRNTEDKHNLASGYKVGFLRPVEYNAPVYRGNTPAGYIITNAEDLAKWIRIQLGTENSIKFDKSVIQFSHIPDRTVSPGVDGSSYACGWFVFQDGGGIISHGGSNPNFSSFILFRPQEKFGIGILANLDSSYTKGIADGIYNIIQGENPKNNIHDKYITIDNTFSIVALISLLVALVTVYLLLVLLLQIIKKERKCIENLKGIITKLLFLLFFLTGFGYCIYRISDIIYWELPWSFIKVWAPSSLLTSIIILFVTVILFCTYFMLTTIFTRKNDKTLFVIVALSVSSGFGNAIIIFVVNEALNRTDSFQFGLLLYFIMGMVLYVYGQRIVRKRLLFLTSNVVYDMRVDMIKEILKSSYEKIEQMENGKIHSGLNNDTEAISNFANVIVSAVSSLVTLICCFIYLGVINIYGLFVSILVIFSAAGLYFAMGRYANKLWEETRDLQNIFFKFINSLTNGLKELKINNKKQAGFVNDMQESCKEYRDKRIKGDLGFANVFVVGELLFTIVIGVVAFVFPIVFKDIQTSSLKDYVFIFLYMTGPVHGVLNSIPQLINARISYRRLNGLMKELESFETVNTVREDVFLTDRFSLELNDIEYTYKNNNSDFFKVGPINWTFQSGEITFITGGNGSGKSTLAKLLTGLYMPDKGDITLNKDNIQPEELRQCYSTIFSDYFLFDKLYGIGQTDENKIDELLKVLHINDKLSIDNDIFSTTKLSSGQRKRLALLVSYLEDKKIYLFDEWASDQDPEFRKLFYEVLLPELRDKNKCIIAISHDDRYFSCADKVIKLEMGQII